MTNQISKQIALFPDVPREPVGHFTDEKTGNDIPVFLNEIWNLFFDLMVLALQTNFTPEGVAIPKQTASNIALLTGTQFNGSIIFDSTNNEFKGNINGTWKTFTLT